ncbi:hypothetical protein HKI87_02g10550 [Chloropicon roscoffensis]|uniref:Uncharacterized protein n=1 Tax=Chloropicon roscoffensis TaxID=1461544 RepID=A0AAX4P0T2_9CHLO
MASAAIKALKEVSTAFEEGLLDEEHYNAFRNLFVESRTRMLTGDDHERGEALVLTLPSPEPEEPDEPNQKADKVQEGRQTRVVGSQSEDQPKRVKRKREEQPKETGCSKCKYMRGGCATCEKVKCDAYLKRWGKDKSKLFSWVFRVLKKAGEGGLHLRDICSRIAKQTDISALTTMEPHSAILGTCTNYPLIFAKVGKKRSGHYRIAEAYL